MVLFERLEQCLKNLLASITIETLGGVKQLRAELEQHASQRRKDFEDLTSSTVLQKKKSFTTSAFILFEKILIALSF